MVICRTIQTADNVYPVNEIRLNLVWCSVDELNSRPSNDRNHIQRLNTKSQIFICKKVKSFVLIQRPILSPSFLSCNRKDYGHIFFQCAKHLQSFPVIFLRLFPERGKPGIRIKLRMSPWWPLGMASILDSGNPWEVIVFLFKTNFESLGKLLMSPPYPQAPALFPSCIIPFTLYSVANQLSIKVTPLPF